MRKIRLLPTHSAPETMFPLYAHCVGSELTPAFFERIARQFDILHTYPTRIEFYADIELRTRMVPSIPKTLAYRPMRKKHANGIRHTQHCLNAELSVTRISFDAIRVSFMRVAVPSVYNRKTVGSISMPERLRNVFERICYGDISLIDCSRFLLVPDKSFLKKESVSFTKISNRLFRQLAAFREAHPEAAPL